MSKIPPNSLSSYTLILISSILLIIFFVGPINGHELSRKLDETVSSEDPSIKCGGCSPCGHPSCTQSPPPPPPPSPPPPKKPPSGPYCPPPPPSPGFIYVPGPPGPPASLYPVQPFSSGAVRNVAAAMKILVWLGLLILWML